MRVGRVKNRVGLVCRYNESWIKDRGRSRCWWVRVRSEDVYARIGSV